MSTTQVLVERLFAACGGADETAIAAALQAGANPDGESEEYGGTALETALTANCPRGAALLVEAGASLTGKDMFGYTPLHYAAYLGDPELITLMLARGADPAAVSKRAHPSFEYFKKGSTPVDIARRADEPALVAALTGGAAGRAGTPPGGAGTPATTAVTPAFAARLATLRAFAATTIDFEGTDAEIDPALAGAGRVAHLVPLGVTGSGSVFALWQADASVALETSPVVYLDSEGDPRSVVAGRLDEFLTLLPFGTGFLYDALAGARAAKAKGAAAKALAAVVEGEAPREGRPFLEWWLATMGAAPAGDPSATIAAARKAHAALHAALAED